MRKVVLAFGEVLWDILPTKTVLGGAVCNFIYRVNSLGDSGIIVSRLGRDDLGRMAFDRVSSLGLDPAYLQWDDDHPTGTVPVTFDNANNPDFEIIPDVAYDYIEMTDSLEEAVAIADCICFGTVAQRTAGTRQTLKQVLEIAGSTPKLLDINLRKRCYEMDTITYLLQKADILKLNEEELYLVAGMSGVSGSDPFRLCGDMIEKWSLKFCVVTLGEKGAIGLSDKGETVYVPGYRVNLVDSVGAGDAFTAGFAHCILRGLSLAEACEFGNILGALVCTKEGGTSPVSQDEIESLKLNGTARIRR